MLPIKEKIRLDLINRINTCFGIKEDYLVENWYQMGKRFRMFKQHFDLLVSLQGILTPNFTLNISGFSRIDGRLIVSVDNFNNEYNSDNQKYSIFRSELFEVADGNDFHHLTGKCEKDDEVILNLTDLDIIAKYTKIFNRTNILKTIKNG